MLQAKDDRGNLVNVLDGLPVGKDFSCPVCKGKVRLKCGQVIRPHFAHVSLQHCHNNYENEGVEHLFLKTELYRILKTKEKVMLEAYLMDICQIADLLVNDRLALEIQCSRLSLERLKERTAAYQTSGRQVLWLTGRKLWLKNRLSSLQKQLLYFSNNIGFHYWELDDDRGEVRLKYLIHENIKGELIYLSRFWKLSEVSLDIFRFPFCQQSCPHLKVRSDPFITHYIQKQLFYGSKKWLKIQEKLYQAGDNLLSWSTEAFFPQYRPPKSTAGFCQIQHNITLYQQQFSEYYQKQAKKDTQILYPPIFYDKIKQSRKGARYVR